MLHGLYVLTDSKNHPLNAWPERIEKAIQGGTSIIQLREKELTQDELLPYALVIREVCNDYGALLIINDHLSLARKIKADGVHLGQHDLSMTKAREYLGTNYLIGVSCYKHLYKAIRAQIHGADYVAFGSIFESPTKIGAPRCPLTVISQAKRCLQIPVCAIGGINQKNIAHVVKAGADLFATSHAVFNADNPRVAANKIYQQVIMAR